MLSQLPIPYVRVRSILKAVSSASCIPLTPTVAPNLRVSPSAKVTVVSKHRADTPKSKHTRPRRALTSRRSVESRELWPPLRVCSPRSTSSIRVSNIVHPFARPLPFYSKRADVSTLGIWKLGDTLELWRRAAWAGRRDPSRSWPRRSAASFLMSRRRECRFSTTRAVSRRLLLGQTGAAPVGVYEGSAMRDKGRRRRELWNPRNPALARVASRRGSRPCPAART